MPKKNILLEMCADIVHYGHINYIRQARELGFKVVVALLEDKVMEQFKRSPIVPYEHRKRMIENVKHVSSVVPLTHFDDYADEEYSNYYFELLKENQIDFVATPFVENGEEYNEYYRDYLYFRQLVDNNLLVHLDYTRGISTSDILSRVKTSTLKDICDLQLYPELDITNFLTDTTRIDINTVVLFKLCSWSPIHELFLDKNRCNRFVERLQVPVVPKYFDIDNILNLTIEALLKHGSYVLKCSSGMCSDNVYIFKKNVNVRNQRELDHEYFTEIIQTLGSTNQDYIDAESARKYHKKKLDIFVPHDMPYVKLNRSPSVIVERLIENSYVIKIYTVFGKCLGGYVKYHGDQYEEVPHLNLDENLDPVRRIKSKSGEYLHLPEHIKKLLIQHTEKIARNTDNVRVDYFYDELNEQHYFNECELLWGSVHGGKDVAERVNDRLARKYEETVRLKGKYPQYFKNLNRKYVENVEFDSVLFQQGLGRFEVGVET